MLSFSFVLFGVRLIHSFSSEFVLFTVSSESVSFSSESDSLLTGHFGVLWDLALCAVVQLFALQRLVALVSAYSSALSDVGDLWMFFPAAHCTFPPGIELVGFKHKTYLTREAP